MNTLDIKQGIAVVCDTSIEMKRCYDDRHELVKAMNDVSKENLKRSIDYYSDKSGVIIDLRKEVLAFLDSGNRLTEKILEELIEKHRKGKERQFQAYKRWFVMFFPVLTLFGHSSIREFVQSFVKKLIADLNIEGKVNYTVIDFQGARQQGYDRLWFAIYNKTQKSQATGLQFFVEFFNGSITYSVYRHRDQEYLRPKIEKTKDEFEYKDLLNYFLTEVDLILKDSSHQNDLNDYHQVKEDALPLNQILYGPPGTGKTYHTVNRALEIIHGSQFMEGKSRVDLLKEFNHLKDENRIGFVTFHQSFSYEDFVEGITPVLLEEDGDQTPEKSEVSYELKEGIFKKMCRMAKGVPSEKRIDDQNYDFENARYFKMSVGGKHNPHIYDWCIKNKKIALGWGRDINYEVLNKYVGNWPVFRDRFKEEYPYLVEESRYHIQAMHAFLKMKKGDVVLISKGNKVIDAVGVIKDDEYVYDDQQEFGYYQFRNVDWIAINLNASPDLFVSKNITQQTIYEFYDEDIKKEYFKKTFNRSNDNSPPEKYVLIIDEINRGNIASIFGELITLIEPDKRLGNPEELQAQIPYSKEWFSVPSNLYIIGTMNTADRSVEALDTALRRRFSFEEMLPKPGLVSPNYMLARLLWDYGEYQWDDPKYKEIEKSLCNLLGADASFDEIKYDIWDSMEKEGFNEPQLEKFNVVNFSGINLEEILNIINTRIEALADRDHTIGHSYFMNVKSENDLRLVFKDKIVPLLQEYFFGDFGKIGLVLGPAFVEQVPEVVQFALIDGYEETAHLQKERYRLKTIDNQFDIKVALNSLLN